MFPLTEVVWLLTMPAVLWLLAMAVSMIPLVRRNG